MHIVLGPGSVWLASLFSKEQKIQELIEVQYIPHTPTDVATQEQFEQNKKIEPQKKPELLNQVVDQDETPINDEIPDETRFLAAKNQNVKKQTTAREQGQFQNKKEMAKSSKKLIQKFLPQFNVAESVRKSIEREKGETDQRLAELARQSAATRPDGQGQESSKTLDYLKGIDPGLETVLATREFLFHGFYNRVKKQLSFYWTDKVREKLNQMAQEGRYVAAVEDKMTRLLVTLDPQGRIVKVQIVGNSGWYDLDQAAVESFRAAGPFPNPPKGMIEEDGSVKLLWEFILEAA